MTTEGTNGKGTASKRRLVRGSGGAPMMAGHLRRLALSLLTLLLALLLVPLAAAPAMACSCAYAPLAPVLIRDADAVFVGRVADKTLQAVQDGVWSSMDPVTYTVEVSEVYKGSVPASQQIVSVRDGASCGLEVRGGEEYAFFSRMPSSRDSQVSPGQLVGSLCDGTTSARPRVLAELREELGPPQPPVSGGVTAPGTNPWPFTATTGWQIGFTLAVLLVPWLL